MRGYKPDEQLESALRMVYSEELIKAQKTALNASLRKYLHTVDNQIFVALLQEYNLLQHLFDVEPQEDLNQTIMKLWEKIITNLKEEYNQETALDTESSSTPEASSSCTL